MEYLLRKCGFAKKTLVVASFFIGLIGLASTVRAAEDLATESLKALLVPASDAWAKEAETFDGSMNALCTAPAVKRPTALKQAREKWIATMKAWRAVGVLPVKRLFAGQFVYGIDWPTINLGLLERTVDFMVPEASSAPANRPVQPRSIELTSVEVRGMTTLGYLLWPDAKPPIPVPTLDQPRTCQYALLLSRQIAQHADKLFADMQTASAFSPPVAHTSAAAATTNEVLLNAIVDGLRQLKKRHAPLLPAVAGRSVPSTPDRPTEIDGARTNESAVFYQASVVQLSAAILGRAPSADSGVPGLVAVLKQANHAELIPPLEQGVAKLGEDARKLPWVLVATNEEHKTLAKQLAADSQQLINQLSGAVSIALGVMVGFGDGDGG